MRRQNSFFSAKDKLIETRVLTTTNTESVSHRRLLHSELLVSSGAIEIFAFLCYHIIVAKLLARGMNNQLQQLGLFTEIIDNGTSKIKQLS